MVADAAQRRLGHHPHDDFGRQTAEMQQTDAGTEVQWSDAANSFVVPAPGGSPAIPIPTKVFEYDRQSRFSAVVLPAVEHPDPGIGAAHPRYEYSYDAQGNLDGIRDNVYQVGSPSPKPTPNVSRSPSTSPIMTSVSKRCTFRSRAS